MTDPQDETVWRNRFIAVNLVRIGGTLLVLASVLLWQSDLFVRGGSIVGLPLMLLGLATCLLGPVRLARKWRAPPGP